MSDEVTSQPLPVRTGEILAGKYEVERVLGTGGMGVVVSAHHVHLKQRVALKLLLPELATNGEVVTRFVREAQNASTIRSEHVVRVTDVGLLPSGAPYMVMEHLEGKDLAHVLIGAGKLPIGLAVDYLLQAMEALAEAHQAGIVHRDLKPSNLFLTERADGSPLIKVLDFGISKVTRTDGDQSSKSLTRTSGLIGSPLYMSPEQIRSSKNVDARTDVWSLGVILYEHLTGKSPFWGEEVNGVLAAIVADEPVPLRQLRSDAPRELEAVVSKCLAKKPEARYQSVGTLARALAPFGSQAAALSVERVVGVLERRTSGVPLAATLESPVIAAAGTAGAWTQRSPEGGALGSKRRRWIAAGFAAVVAVAGGALALRNQGPSAASSATSEPVPPTTATPAAAPALPTSEPAAKPDVSPSTSIPEVPSAAPPSPEAPSVAKPSNPPAGSPSARTLTTHRRIPPPIPVTKPTGTTTKKPPSLGDMIDERR
jgi:serine/threonine-protein kinase